MDLTNYIFIIGMSIIGIILIMWHFDDSDRLKIPNEEDNIAE